MNLLGVNPRVAERELADVALRERGDPDLVYRFLSEDSSGHFYGTCERYGLVPLHNNVSEWMYVNEDPQLAIAIEEVVNTFSPALSVELLLYNVLGSNSESAACLVRYLVNYYAANHVCEHVKNTMRNMIRWAVLAGFVPCMFIPWRKVRVATLGLSGKAAVNRMVAESSDGNHHRSAGGKRFRRDETTAHSHSYYQGRKRQQRVALRTVSHGLSRTSAAEEAVQEQDVHDKAIPAMLDVPLDKLTDTLRMLMAKSVSPVHTSVVCKIIGDWIASDPAVRQNPVKETELKMATVALWGVMKTFEHGRCPVIPDCNAATFLAFYDTQTDMITAAVDGVLYRQVYAWESCCSGLSSIAKRVQPTVSCWAKLFHRIMHGLTEAATRQIYTSSAENSSLVHLADAMAGSRKDPRPFDGAPLSNSFNAPLVDSLSRALTSEVQPGMFGLNTDIPENFLRPGTGSSFSDHKSASVFHSLSNMMTALLKEGKELLVVKQFMSSVMTKPEAAIEALTETCSNQRLLHMATDIANHVSRIKLQESQTSDCPYDPVKDLGSGVKLVCNYQSTVSVAQLEETLSLWTNFWRSVLSGFSQFNRRHNTIQYNNRDTVRELESGSPVHVFHCSMVNLLNTSGVTFADSLSGRKPDSSLAVNDIMLTKDSLHPSAYGLLLANKLGLRPSDVKAYTVSDAAQHTVQYEAREGAASGQVH